MAEVKAILGRTGDPTDAVIGLNFGMRADTLWLPSRHNAITGRRSTDRGDFLVDFRARDPREPVFEIMVTSHHGMVVRPQATNVVHIEPGRF